MKNKITNIIAVLLVIVGILYASIDAVTKYLNTVPEGGEVDVFKLLLAIGGAIVAWYTGKDAAGKALKTFLILLLPAVLIIGATSKLNIKDSKAFCVLISPTNHLNTFEINDQLLLEVKHKQYCSFVNNVNCENYAAEVYNKTVRKEFKVKIKTKFKNEENNYKNIASLFVDRLRLQLSRRNC